jgi:hypothetical protein
MLSGIFMVARTYAMGNTKLSFEAVLKGRGFSRAVSAQNQSRL